MDLELGSIIVLGCKRIKDLTYLVDDLNDKLLQSSQDYQSIVAQYTEKAQQLDQMQQNLLSLLSFNNQPATVNPA